MREEKKIITAEYVEWLKSSPYFIIVDYNGLTVDQFDELRARVAAGAELTEDEEGAAAADGI